MPSETVVAIVCLCVCLVSLCNANSQIRKKSHYSKRPIWFDDYSQYHMSQQEQKQNSDDYVNYQQSLSHNNNRQRYGNNNRKSPANQNQQRHKNQQYPKKQQHHENQFNIKQHHTNEKVFEDHNQTRHLEDSNSNDNSTKRDFSLNRHLQFYVKNDPPDQINPTEVKLGIYINSFYSISEQTMDYSVSMYLRQHWVDKRLKFNPEDFQVKQTPLDNLHDLNLISWLKLPIRDEVRLGEGSWNSVWVPDTFFRNEKRATFHEVTVKNRMLRLNYTGNMWYVTKVSATLSCPMKLYKYPFDTQVCPMLFESFGYTMDTMYFSWLEKPVELDEHNELPQFVYKNHTLFDCVQNYTGGAFPCLEVRFILRRDVGYFLIQVYVPSMLIVILSWVSFWINVDASPARVSIGLLTVLTTTTQSTGINSALPRVSYIKAIDVWMSVCLLFVFCALLEYALVNVLARKRGVQILHSIPRPVFAKPVQQLTTIPATTNNAESQLDQINLVENGADRRQPPKVVDPEGRQKARKVDKVSRRAFPLAFLVFALIYWVMYTLPFEDDVML